MEFEGNAKLIKFESNVQFIKYEVLKQVAKLAFDGTINERYKEIPYEIVKGKKPITRCCVYKERAIVEERVQVAMKGYKQGENVVKVIEAACDECPINRFVVTEACRGCLAHRCSEACPKGAITHVEHKAYINQEMCIECGRCREACPYNAIAEVKRPCVRVCPTGALTVNEEKKAEIKDEDCIQCGACVFACPFGAIMDKSSIVDVINLIREKKSKQNFKIYAVIAPAIASQFTYAKIGQVVNAIKKLGFHHVIETALGADIIAQHETNEFSKMSDEEKFMTSSCCPAFVSYIQKKYKNLSKNISTAVSPMIAVSRLIKNTDPDAKVIFIGPCIAKKMEIMQEDLKDSTDYVLTFEELLAMLDADDIDINECDEDVLDNASFFGRIFARSGGLTEAIKDVVSEYNLDVDFKPVVCNGIKECDMALKMAKVNRLNGNFMEGMVCEGGCIGGPASLKHGKRDKGEVDKYGKMAIEKGVKDALRVFNIDELDLERKQ